MECPLSWANDDVRCTRLCRVYPLLVGEMVHCRDPPCSNQVLDGEGVLGFLALRQRSGRKREAQHGEEREGAAHGWLLAGRSRCYRAGWSAGKGLPPPKRE